MTYRILRQATIGTRPVQNYVHEAGATVEFRNYMAAQLEVARLKKAASPGTKFTIVGSTKH
jgi:hypothetical protein